MQPTPPPVVKFAHASLARVWCAADAGCYLLAEPVSLARRLMERGDPEKFAYAKTRLELIEQLPFPKVDTSAISAGLAADRVADKIREWVADAA